MILTNFIHVPKRKGGWLVVLKLEELLLDETEGTVGRIWWWKSAKLWQAGVVDVGTTWHYSYWMGNCQNCNEVVVKIGQRWDLVLFWWKQTEGAYGKVDISPWQTRFNHSFMVSGTIQESLTHKTAIKMTAAISIAVKFPSLRYCLL